MQEILAVWLDGTGDLGVLEQKNHRFGSSFHPIKRNEERKGICLINNLWYTTYTGARHYFRSPSNNYHVAGRMQKVDLKNLESLRLV